MANNHIPPQAYTREDVAKAYVWVQSQPEYVKNMATSRDALVALYLQARRNGVASLENLAPVSSKDFQTQLQSLASELNQFEKTKETLTATTPLKPAQHPIPPSAPSTPEFSAQSFNQNLDINSGYEFDQKPQEMNFQEAKPQPRYDERSVEFKISERRKSNEGLSLDPKSQKIVDSVKAQLNLESDADVLRMLLTLGYDKLKAIFPQK